MSALSTPPPPSQEGASEVEGQVRSEAKPSERTPAPLQPYLRETIDDLSALKPSPDPVREEMARALEGADSLMSVVLPTIEGYKPHEGLGLIHDRVRTALLHHRGEKP